MEMAEWTELVFGRGYTPGLLYTVLSGIQVSPKSKRTLSQTLFQTVNLAYFCAFLPCSMMTILIVFSLVQLLQIYSTEHIHFCLQHTDCDAERRAINL